VTLGRNPLLRCNTGLPLSAVVEAGRDGASSLSSLLHRHHRRLCATCSAVRFRALNPSPPTRAAARAEAVAAAIREADGTLFGAIARFGISYSHATRIRRGWRPGGVRALPIPYRSRGYLPDGSRPGWSWEATA